MLRSQFRPVWIYQDCGDNYKNENRKTINCIENNIKPD